MTSHPHRPPPGAHGVAATLAGAAALAAGLVAPLAGVAGATGVAGLPPSAVVTRATDSVRSASALVLTGTLRSGSGRLAFDVASTAHGTAARGVFVSHARSVGFTGRLDFVERRGAVYLHAGRVFWAAEVARGGASLTPAQRAAAAAVLAGHWIEMTGTSAKAMEASVGPLTHPADFARTLLSARALGTLHKGRLTHFRGHLVVPVTSSKGGTLYVAARGPARPVGFVARAGSASGTILFGYPSHLAVAAPAGSRTVAQVVKAVAG